MKKNKFTKKREAEREKPFKLEGTVHELMEKISMDFKATPRKRCFEMEETFVEANDLSNQQKEENDFSKVEDNAAKLSGLSPSSPDFSEQLQEVLNEKIKSLHSSRDQILVMSSPTNGQQEYQQDIDREEHSADSPNRSSSPENISLAKGFSRVSDNLTLSDSSYALTSGSETKTTISKTIFDINQNNEATDQGNPNRHSNIEEKSNDSAEKDEENNKASNNERNFSWAPESFGYSSEDGNSSPSVFETVYSPPTRSSFSNFEKKSLNTFFDSNSSFSLENKDPVTPPSEASCSRKNDSKKSNESLYKTIASTPLCGKKSTRRGVNEEVEKARGEAREKLNELPLTKPGKIASRTTSEPKFEFIRDKRLSYFLAIEQGNKEGALCELYFVL